MTGGAISISGDLQPIFPQTPKKPKTVINEDAIPASFFLGEGGARNALLEKERVCKKSDVRHGFFQRQYRRVARAFTKIFCISPVRKEVEARFKNHSSLESLEKEWRHFNRGSFAINETLFEFVNRGYKEGDELFSQEEIKSYLYDRARKAFFSQSEKIGHGQAGGELLKMICEGNLREAEEKCAPSPSKIQEKKEMLEYLKCTSIPDLEEDIDDLKVRVRKIKGEGASDPNGYEKDLIEAEELLESSKTELEKLRQEIENPRTPFYKELESYPVRALPYPQIAMYFQEGSSIREDREFWKGQLQRAFHEGRFKEEGLIKTGKLQENQKRYGDLFFHILQSMPQEIAKSLEQEIKDLYAQVPGGQAALRKFVWMHPLDGYLSISPIDTKSSGIVEKQYVDPIAKELVEKIIEEAHSLGTGLPGTIKLLHKSSGFVEKVRISIQQSNLDSFKKELWTEERIIESLYSKTSDCLKQEYGLTDQQVKRLFSLCKKHPTGILSKSSAIIAVIGKEPVKTTDFTDSFKEESLTEVERQHLELLSRAIELQKEGRSGELSKKEKEDLKKFLDLMTQNASFRKKLNAKLCEFTGKGKTLSLKDQLQLLVGGTSKQVDKDQDPVPLLMEGGIELANVLTHKAKWVDKGLAASEKLRVLKEKVESGQEVIESEKLDYKDFGALKVVDDLASLLSVLDFGVFDADDVFSRILQVSKENKDLFWGKRGLEKMLEKQIAQHYLTGDILAEVGISRSQTEAKKLHSEQLQTVRFITSYTHGAKIFCDKKKVHVSHVLGPYTVNEIGIRDLVFSDIWRMNPSKLIPLKRHVLLKEKLGDHWEERVCKMFQEEEAKIHKMAKADEAFGKVHNDTDKRFQAGKADWWMGSHFKKAEEAQSFEEWTDEFLSKHKGSVSTDEKPYPMICSDFVTSVNCAALVRLNQRLQKELSSDEQVIDLPYNKREDFSMVHPGRMVSLLADKGCIERVQPPPLIKALLKTDRQREKLAKPWKRMGISAG